jgi:hypothetical protein
VIGATPPFTETVADPEDNPLHNILFCEMVAENADGWVIVAVLVIEHPNY